MESVISSPKVRLDKLTLCVRWCLSSICCPTFFPLWQFASMHFISFNETCLYQMQLRWLVDEKKCLQTVLIRMMQFYVTHFCDKLLISKQLFQTCKHFFAKLNIVNIAKLNMQFFLQEWCSFMWWIFINFWSLNNCFRHVNFFAKLNLTVIMQNVAIFSSF